MTTNDHHLKPGFSVTPESAGWEYLSFAVVDLAAGEVHTVTEPDRETAIVPIAGSGVVTAGGSTFPLARTSVFAQMPSVRLRPARNTTRGQDLRRVHVRDRLRAGHRPVPGAVVRAQRDAQRVPRRRHRVPPGEPHPGRAASRRTPHPVRGLRPARHMGGMGSALPRRARGFAVPRRGLSTSGSIPTTASCCTATGATTRASMSSSSPTTATACSSPRATTPRSRVRRRTCTS